MRGWIGCPSSTQVLHGGGGSSEQNQGDDRGQHEGADADGQRAWGASSGVDRGRRRQRTSNANRMMPPNRMPDAPTQYCRLNIHQYINGGRVTSMPSTGSERPRREDTASTPRPPSSIRPSAPIRRRWWRNGSPVSVGLLGGEILWY